MKRKILIILLLCLGMVVHAQVTYQGVITDMNGEALIGASVVVQGTTNGTVTDFDGNYEITCAAGALLEFSYIGYKTQVLPASQDMHVSLLEDSEELSEVVVVGYGSLSKKEVSSSVVQVSREDFNQGAVSDAMGLVAGKIAGLNVSSVADANPNSMSSLQVRGATSLYASNEPLVVIDGIAGGDLRTIASQDVESITVLKDAASASIYGSRAANGVIIITTKGGKDGKVKIDFDASLSVQTYAHKMKVLNAKEFCQVMWQGFVNDGLNPNLNGLGYHYDWAYDAKGVPMLNNITMSKYLDAAGTTPAADTDWFKETTRTGLAQQYNVSLSNGSEKGSSFFSLGYYKNKGIIRQSDFERFSGRMNTDYKLLKIKERDIITVGEHFTLNRTSEVQAPGGFLENVLQFNPSLPVYTTNGEYAGPVGGYPDRENPVARLDRNSDNRYIYWRMFGDAFININPIKNFNIKSTFGLDYAQKQQRIFTYPITEGTVANATNGVEAKQEHWTKWMWNAIATYNIEKGKHHGDAMVGMELNREDDVWFSGKKYDYAVLTPDYMWPNAGTGIQTVTGAGDSYKLMSYFGKIDYNWNDQLLASFTMRYDGSSRFGKNNQYGFFPSASLGYRLSKHINASWLHDWKIRASYGVTGNQGMNSNTAHYGLYVANYGADRENSTAYDLNLQGSGTLPSGYYKLQSANEDLKWESSSQWNFGTDFSLFGGDLYGSYDLFFKETKDMLVQPAFLGAIGFGGQTWINGPTLKNWGMEFNLGYRHQTAYGLTYDVTGNVDFYRSKVTYLPEKSKNSYEHNDYHNLAQDEKAYGSLIGYVVEGLYQSREEVLAAGQAGARVGGLKYADLNGDGRINEADRTWVFNPVPDFSYGVNVNLGYKDFDFTMFWQGVAGVDVINNQKYQTDFWSITDAGSNKGERLTDAWTPANSGSSIPALTTSNGADEGRMSSYYVENGSYVKLRTLQLGYTLPASLAKRLLLSKARIYLSGDNLCTIKSSSLTCSDPESTAWNYPHTASFTFGVQVGF